MDWQVHHWLAESPSALEHRASIRMGDQPADWIAIRTLIADSGKLDADRAQVLKRTLVRLALMEGIAGRDLPDDISGLLGPEAPALGCPALAELRRFTLALAAAPISAEPSAPGILFLLLAADPEGQLPVSNPQPINGLENWQRRHPCIRIYTWTSDPTVCAHPISGQSWQLAAELALIALQDTQSELRSQLATKWLATGTVQFSRIGYVDIGNKLALGTLRHMLMPASTFQKLLVAPRWRGKLRRAWTIDGAISAVVQRGTQQGDSRTFSDFPADTIMVSFCSLAQQPPIACALHLQPRSMLLVHSEEEVSAGSCMVLSAIVARLSTAGLLSSPAITSHSLPSEDLVRIEHCLYQLLEPYLTSDRQVVLNMTGGNRLMAFAAHSLARSNPTLSLIYRDIDADPGNWICLSFDGLYPTTSNLVGNCEASEINWTYLYGRRPLALPSAESILKQLLH